MTGVVTAYLIGLAPLLVRFSQEVRFYSLSVLTMVALVYFFVRAWEHPSRKNWFVAGVTLVVAFFTHYYVGLVVVALMGFLVGVVGVKMWRTGSLTVSPELRTRLLVGGGAVLLLALVAVPWLLYALPTRGRAWWFEISSLPELIGEPLTSGHVGGAWHLLAVRILGLVVFPAVGLVGLAAGLRAGKTWLAAMALVVVVGAGGVVALDQAFYYFFTSRQLLFVVPFYMILFATGLVAVAQMLGRVNRALGAAVLVGTLSGITLVFGLSVRAYYDWPKDDWRSAAQFMMSATRTHPAPIVTEPNSARGYLAYYEPELWSRLTPTTTVDTLPEGAAPARAWFVILGTRVSSRLEFLAANGWQTIYLHASPMLALVYAGRAPAEVLWREVASVDVPPQLIDLFRFVG